MFGNCQAQVLYGSVKNQKNKPLDGANVVWLNTNEGTYTGMLGDFSIPKTTESKYLVASYIGYYSDTIEVSAQNFIQFNLEPDGTIEEVIIAQEREGIEISSLNAIKTENITSTELRKAACCDLAGCFETNTSVKAQTTNFITNAKELRILGLSGVYNQVLVDGIPLIQGLTYTYGISGIPGTLVNNIYIAKGANSVLQGFESISGQINVITKPADKTDKLLLNAYVNSFGMRQLNANFAFIKNKWSNITALHNVQPPAKFDRDEDTFLDMPQISRYMVYNKTQYGTDRELGWNAMFTARFMNENRSGGQVDFNKNNEISINNPYGQSVTINQPEFTAKAGYRLSDNHNFIVQTAIQYQNQNSIFGTTEYKAKQLSNYLNFQYEYNYRTANNFKTGVSNRYLKLDETINFPENSLGRTYAGNYLKNENILGVFAENKLSFFDEQFTWMLGIRADNHNEYGVIFSPRTLIQYNITENSDLRASIGKGWRSVNLFSENINLLSSSRDIIFEETINAEEAINLGVNFTQKFDNENIKGYFTTDLYQTRFQNQFFPDYDSDPTKAFIRNFDGKSISNAFQAEMNLTFSERFETKLGYNFLDVYQIKEDASRFTLPFNSKHKILAVLGYQPLNKKFRVDLNAHWYSKQRLPNTSSNPVEFQRPDYSEAYAFFNFQVTYNYKRFEFYGGCENIFDFRQERPIISWENPYSQYFDTSSVWGPTKGREFYFGIRYRIKNEE